MTIFTPATTAQLLGASFLYFVTRDAVPDAAPSLPAPPPPHTRPRRGIPRDH